MKRNSVSIQVLDAEKFLTSHCWTWDIEAEYSLTRIYLHKLHVKDIDIDVYSTTRQCQTVKHKATVDDPTDRASNCWIYIVDIWDQLLTKKKGLLYQGLEARSYIRRSSHRNMAMPSSYTESNLKRYSQHGNLGHDLHVSPPPHLQWRSTSETQVSRTVAHIVARSPERTIWSLNVDNWRKEIKLYQIETATMNIVMERLETIVKSHSMLPVTLSVSTNEIRFTENQ